MQLLADGAYSISDDVSIPGEGISPFVFCAGWLMEILEIESGEFYFFREAEEVRPRGNRFGVFYPPFTIVRSYVRDLRGRVRGVGTIDHYPELPRFPMIFETDFDGPFTDARQATELLSSCRYAQSIETGANASLISRKAKKLIDENYTVQPSIARIAGRLKVSHEHLSRQFKRDYEMTPSAYLRELRVADATFRLTTGEKIIDISQDVGYNDLSRFYKQFRKTTRTSPGDCRTILGSRT
jgi:AraC-like DNA-binding protein